MLGVMGYIRVALIVYNVFPFLIKDIKHYISERYFNLKIKLFFKSLNYTIYGKVKYVLQLFENSLLNKTTLLLYSAPL